MSEQLHIEQSTYSRYETDKAIPATDIITRIAESFNVSPDWLLSDNNPIHFEKNNIHNGSVAVINNGTLHSCGISKDLLDMLLSQQKALQVLLEKLIERL